MLEVSSLHIDDDDDGDAIVDNHRVQMDNASGWLQWWTNGPLPVSPFSSLCLPYSLQPIITGENFRISFFLLFSRHQPKDVLLLL